MPDFSFEAEAHARGVQIVAGADEAGRGPLAGPVVAAAVILDQHNIPEGLNDSKKLTEKKREALFDQIIASALVSVVSAPPSVIETFNIRGASLWAMKKALLGLSVRPNLALIDGRDVPPGMPCAGQAVIGGDAKSVSIAAASIIAKVTRDRMCAQMAIDAPAYKFGKHKGYGTKVHVAALQEHGPCPHHRKAFAPVKALLTHN